MADIIEKVKIKDKEYELPLSDACFVLALQDLTRSIIDLKLAIGKHK